MWYHYSNIKFPYIEQLWCLTIQLCRIRYSVEASTAQSALHVLYGLLGTDTDSPKAINLLHSNFVLFFIG